MQPDDSQQGQGSLRSRLSRRVNADPAASRSGRNHAAFRALAAEIADALREGFSVKAVWALLLEENRISMGYDTFRLHCKAAGMQRRTKVDLELLPEEEPWAEQDVLQGSDR